VNVCSLYSTSLLVLDSQCYICYYAAIRIGFELSRYEFLEPEFEEFIDEFYIPESGLLINGPVYLAKENNVTTEQTFQIIIQISNVAPPGEGIQPATPEEDYQANQLSTINFPPTIQRQNFQFTLLTDDTPEDTEAFQIGSTPSSQFGAPIYQAPSAFFPQTFIIIQDDDGIYYKCMLLHAYFYVMVVYTLHALLAVIVTYYQP
jgi:hypothetical protein